MKKLTGTFVAVGLALSQQASFATESDDTIVVAFSELAPWKVNEGNQYKGVYAEILKELAKGLNKELKFRSCPLKRCLLMMEEGSADWIIGVKNTSEREQWITFIDTPYRHTATKVFYVRLGESKRLTQYEDLYDLTIGVKIGARYFKQFDAGTGLSKEQVARDEQNFKKLVSGRIDTFPINAETGAIHLANSEYRDLLERADFSYTAKGLRSVGVSKKSKHIHLRDQMNTLMQNMVESGKLDDIYRIHFFEQYGVAKGAYQWR
ncbi:transporter substrate-binding domain-containing protein [Vibrio lamellibrachiae]|uniref:substrate-binding periplasmic protein n=1 Tax=Vibrio lamellibrachiae TaxID=2910253 RepID=UPI003D10E290